MILFLAWDNISDNYVEFKGHCNYVVSSSSSSHSSQKNLASKRFLLKPGVVATHASPTAKHFFLSNLHSPGPFNFISLQILCFLLKPGVAATHASPTAKNFFLSNHHSPDPFNFVSLHILSLFCSRVGPRTKTGHPACRHNLAIQAGSRVECLRNIKIGFDFAVDSNSKYWFMTSFLHLLPYLHGYTIGLGRKTVISLSLSLSLSPSLPPSLSHTRTHTHARTHARTLTCH